MDIIVHLHGLRARIVIIVMAAGYLSGCSSTCASPPPKSEESKGSAICSIRTQPTSPIVTLWDSTDKSALEASLISNEGIFTVRVQDDKVIPTATCKLSGGRYTYARTGPYDGRCDLESATDASLKLAYGGVGVGAMAELTTKFSILTSIRGSFELRGNVTPLQISGDDDPCTLSTHYVSGAQTGAFVTLQGDLTRYGGTVDALGVLSGNLKRSTGITTFDSSGDVAACSSQSHENLPHGCTTPIQVVLKPIPRRKQCVFELLNATDVSTKTPIQVGECLFDNDGQEHEYELKVSGDITSKCDATDQGFCSWKWWFFLEAIINGTAIRFEKYIPNGTDTSRDRLWTPKDLVIGHFRAKSNVNVALKATTKDAGRSGCGNEQSPDTTCYVGKGFRIVVNLVEPSK